MRGRVVALYIMAFMGSTAIGGPLVGAVGQLLGPRASLGVGALGCLAAVLLALAYGHGERRRPSVASSRASSPASAVPRRPAGVPGD
jgi:predicted MFS family arabinose efflux permease